MTVGLAVAVAACSSFKGSTDAEADGGGADGVAPVPAGDGGGTSNGDGSTPSGSSDSGQPTASFDSGNDGHASASDAGGDDATPPMGSDGGSSSGDSGPGAIEVLVDNLAQATLITVDANNIYFGVEGSTTGTVYQCPKSGCATPTVLGPGFATGLGVDGSRVYWNDFAVGSIVSCAIGGCANEPTVLAPSQTEPEGLTFDGTNLYWATSGSIMTCVAPSCAQRTTLATGQPTNIVQMASETNVAFWIGTSNVESCPAAGCSASPATVGPASGSSIVVKDGFAYFTSGNAIVSCPVGGCTAPHTIGASDDPYGLGTDGTNVYWLDDIDEVVYRCPVTGCSGGATRFAEQQLTQPGGNVALDGEYAYWTLPDQVLRKPK